MSLRTLLMTAVITTVALAGCSDPPPSGDIGSGALAVDVQGDIEAEYTAASYPAEATGQPDLYESLCDPSGQIPGGECTEASSFVRVMLHVAPEPNANEYVAYYAGGTDPAEMEIGAMSQDDAGMWVVENTFEGENYDGAFTQVEVRMGPTVIATGPSSGGSMAVAETLSGVTATASYEGKLLTAEVSGLDSNDSYMGWLVAANEDSGENEHTASFPISNGANEYEAPMNIADYVEFHIHISGSKVNVYAATI